MMARQDGPEAWKCPINLPTPASRKVAPARSRTVSLLENTDLGPACSGPGVPTPAHAGVRLSGGREPGGRAGPRFRAGRASATRLPAACDMNEPFVERMVSGR